MSRPSPLIWLALFFILLVPTAAGRVLLDVAGGLILISLAIPILVSGIGWIGWRIIQSRMVTCNACGASSFSNSSQCPLCGSTSLSQNTPKKKEENTSNSSTPASSATIDISAIDSGQD